MGGRGGGGGVREFVFVYGKSNSDDGLISDCFEVGPGGVYNYVQINSFELRIRVRIVSLSQRATKNDNPWLRGSSISTEYTYWTRKAIS